ncbi:hypothetical protein ACLBW0_03120 [Enterobacteriaceae bacterium C34A]
MNKYIVFIKDNESKVVLEEQVTRGLNRELKKKGFTQYPYPIEANNQKEAIQELNRQGSEHLEDLSQFSGSICFYCAVLVINVTAGYVISLFLS